MKWNKWLRVAGLVGGMEYGNGSFMILNRYLCSFLLLAGGRFISIQSSQWGGLNIRRKSPQYK